MAAILRIEENDLTLDATTRDGLPAPNDECHSAADDETTPLQMAKVINPK